MIDITPVEASQLINRAQWYPEYRTLDEFCQAYAGIYAPSAVKRELLRIALAGDIERACLNKHQVWQKVDGEYRINEQLRTLWVHDGLAERYWEKLKYRYLGRYKPNARRKHRHRQHRGCTPACPKYGLPWTTT